MLDVVNKQRLKLAQSIRAYCVSNASEWKKVPWLAIEAQGHGGWSSALEAAYYGLWQIYPQDGYITMYIDCSNGHLLYHLKPASDDQVVELSRSLYLLDVSKVIRELKEHAQDPYTGHTGSYADYPAFARKKDAEKEVKKRLYGVTKSYHRQKSLPKEFCELERALRVT